MARNKVVYFGETVMDISDTTAVASDVAAGKYFYGADGVKTAGTNSGGGGQVIVTETTDANGGTIVTITGETVSLQSKSVTPTTAQQTVVPDTGYHGLSSVAVDAIPSQYIVPTGTLSITENGTKDVTQYASVSVDVQGGGTDTSDATLTSGGQMLDGVTAYSNGTKYTGTIPTKTSADLTASGATVTVPSGYYASHVQKSVASGTEGTPTATKGTVSNNSLTVTPSVTNTAGYISGGTHSGTGVTVTASELVSGTKTITENGTGIDVTNYASVDVNVSPNLQTKSVTYTPTTSTQTATVTADSSYDGLDGVSITVNPIPSQYVTTTDATATASDINSGETAYVNGVKVTGTQVIQTYYTGTTNPSSSTGSDGDIYLKVVS